MSHRKNTIEIIYTDDTGLDHHVMTEKVKPFRAASPAQSIIVEELCHELSNRMGAYLKIRGKAWRTMTTNPTDKISRKALTGQKDG